MGDKEGRGCSQEGLLDVKTEDECRIQAEANGIAFSGNWNSDKNPGCFMNVEGRIGAFWNGNAIKQEFGSGYAAICLGIMSYCF